MLRKIVIGAVLFTLILSMAGCGGKGEPIKARWIEPQVVGDIVSIPVSEVNNNKIIHFRLYTPGGDTAFIAYELDGEIHVRAFACPCPECRATGFISLEKEVLICDMCGTTYNAKTGDGIEGAFVNYPKAPVPYKITDGNIVMNETDLIAAHQATLISGWP